MKTLIVLVLFSLIMGCQTRTKQVEYARQKDLIVLDARFNALMEYLELTEEVYGETVFYRKFLAMDIRTDVHFTPDPSGKFRRLYNYLDIYEATEPEATKIKEFKESK